VSHPVARVFDRCACTRYNQRLASSVDAAAMLTLLSPHLCSGIQCHLCCRPLTLLQVVFCDHRHFGSDDSAVVRMRYRMVCSLSCCVRITCLPPLQADEPQDVLIVIAVWLPLYMQRHFLSCVFACLFFPCRQRYITTSREIKRWDATSRSPVYASFSATLKVGCAGCHHQRFVWKSCMVFVGSCSLYASLA
jgi:hypothetical protein